MDFQSYILLYLGSIALWAVTEVGRALIWLGIGVYLYKRCSRICN